MNAPSEIAKRPAGRIVPQLVGGVVLVVGLVVLAGLAFGLPAVMHWLPKVLLIKANAAIAFMLSGGALILLQVPSHRAHVAARVCALVVGGIALLTLAEYAGGWDFGIDEWVLGARGIMPGSPHPGRMALNSAAGFGLFAAAL